jgi:hypothetical protein
MKIGQLERPEVASVVPAADGMLRSDVPVGEADSGGIPSVRPAGGVPDSLPHPILLFVDEPVTGDELAELCEDLGRERILAAKVLGLGDESEQPLRIPGGERVHGSFKKI